MSRKSFNHRSIALQRAIHEILSFENVHFRTVFLSPRPTIEYFNDGQAANLAVTRAIIFGQALSRYLQMHSVIETAEKCIPMLSRYPWDKQKISRSEHIQFVWHAFTHQCYLLKERSEKFQTDMNQLRKAFSDAETSLKSTNKSVLGKIGKFIAFRGEHTHEWPISHEIYDFFNMLEVVESISSEYGDRVMRIAYGAAKNDAIIEIESGLDRMAEVFANYPGEPLSSLLRYARLIEEAFNTLDIRVRPLTNEELLEHSRRRQEELQNRWRK